MNVVSTMHLCTLQYIANYSHDLHVFQVMTLLQNASYCCLSLVHVCNTVKNELDVPAVVIIPS